MEKDSLGLIEVLGLVGAIEAADAGSKAAKVTFRGYQRGLAGLITVFFTGDVAAVRAAISAGVAAAKRVGQVVSVDVIARPDRQLHVTRNGTKPVQHETPETLETATPAEPPQAIASEGAGWPTEPAMPELSTAEAEPSSQESTTAVAVAEVNTAVAVAEPEEPIAFTDEQPAQSWTETLPGGGNGDVPAAQVSVPEEVVVAAAEAAAPPTRNKERVRKTKARKKV